MELYKFQAQVGGKDSFAIRARQLDENFARLQPQTNGTYGINETGSGWSLDIFPAYPASTTQALYLTYTGGSLQWSAVGAAEPPPSGVASWREVERCDGKKMYVWGTEWE